MRMYKLSNDVYNNVKVQYSASKQLVVESELNAINSCIVRQVKPCTHS